MNKRFMLSIATATAFVALLFLWPQPPAETPQNPAILTSNPSRNPPSAPRAVHADPAKNEETKKENLISYRLTSTQRIGYGPGEKQMGFLSRSEQEIAGPESFTADGKGNFVVCDTLNQKIHILNTNGDHTEFELSREIAPGDVAVYESESIVVYDYAGQLHQFDFDGSPISSVDFDHDRWTARLELRIVGEQVFVQCADQFDHLVGVLEKGLLRLPNDEELQRSEKIAGAQSASGRRYLAQLERWERGWIDVWESNGQPAAQLPLDVPGIVSARFLGEDFAGNVFVQVERVESETVFLEVHRFDADGNAAAEVEIPENDYFFWTAKLLSVDADGNIYQSLPQPEGMKFNLFQPLDPGES